MKYMSLFTGKGKENNQLTSLTQWRKFLKSY